MSTKSKLIHIMFATSKERYYINEMRKNCNKSQLETLNKKKTET